MPYAVLVSYEGEARNRIWEPTGIVFDDGKEAGAYVKNENMEMTRWRRSVRYRAIKITDDNPLLWREREQKRFEEGINQKVPWADAIFSTGMYEHIDPDDGTKVRFIASQEDGMAGRYTSMSPGRFLRKYHGAIEPDLVDKWCAQMGLDETTSELKIATTVDDIVRVYTEGPHSCMAYTMTHGVFSKVDRHPVSVYGDSDIAVAYIERYEEITARCIIWPDKKIHGRIYGDRERLLERLKEHDYVEDWNGFAGARIRQLRVDNSRKTLILPYIDGDLGVIKDGDEWLILTDKPHIIAKSPYGLCLASKCMHCGQSDVWLSEYRGPDDDYDEPEYICAEGCKH